MKPESFMLVPFLFLGLAYGLFLGHPFLGAVTGVSLAVLFGVTDNGKTK